MTEASWYPFYQRRRKSSSLTLVPACFLLTASSWKEGANRRRAKMLVQVWQQGQISQGHGKTPQSQLEAKEGKKERRLVCVGYFDDRRSRWASFFLQIPDRSVQLGQSKAVTAPLLVLRHVDAPSPAAARPDNTSTVQANTDHKD